MLAYGRYLAGYMQSYKINYSKAKDTLAAREYNVPYPAFSIRLKLF